MIDIVIPTYKPDEKFEKLIDRLLKQSIKPNKIYVINTEEKYFNFTKYNNISTVDIRHISKDEFDHGKTRNYAASLSSADFILFMTQDATPVDNHLISEIIKPFEDEEVWAVYGRQLPSKFSSEIEKYTREFNYPENDSKKSIEDIERLGIKTYFCSNVCACYRKKNYDEIGGFVLKTIFNEDMIFAYEIINRGGKIYYASNAMVVHSHNYSYMGQLTRNFDLAVSQKQYSKIFSDVKSENEGIKLVKSTIKYLISIKKFYLIPDLILQSGFKYIGYKLGLKYDKLPIFIIKKLSMNKSYWKDYERRRNI